MKIGLIDVDSHNFPNLALMKISAWHKSQGDTVEWFFPMSHYDKVYMAKVFDFTPDFETVINADEVIYGGTGYDLQKKLPDEIEHIYPDYSLYGIKNTAYGYLTRGCPRGCGFCIVGKKEGLKSYKVADLTEFWRGQREIVISDPNLLACKDRIELLQQLIDSKAWIDINQGLDIRFMDEEAAYMVNQLKLKMLHFAWDDMKQSDVIISNLTKFKQSTEFDFRRLRVYVLTNFDTTEEQDLYRIYKLKELGYDPYLMIYDKQNAPKRLRKMQRWVNNKFIFRSGQAETFEDYLKGVKP
jgi:hypothetical protein